MTPAESTALRGLLLLVVEVTNLATTSDLSPEHKLDDINDLLDSDHAREHVQLARAVLDTELPATALVNSHGELVEALNSAVKLLDDVLHCDRPADVVIATTLYECRALLCQLALPKKGE